MSKKVLEEQAVRKFMKIAGLQPLTNSFLKESEEQKDLEEMKGAMGARMASLGDEADDAIANVGSASDEEDDSYEADLYGPELSKDQEIDDMLEKMGVDPSSKEGVDLRVAIKAAAEKHAARYSDRRDDILAGGDGSMHGDPLAQRQSPRITKKGKPFKSDSDRLKYQIAQTAARGGLEENKEELEEGDDFDPSNDPSYVRDLAFAVDDEERAKDLSRYRTKRNAERGRDAIKDKETERMFSRGRVKRGRVGLEEVEELEEGGGQMPFDAADRRADERAPDGVNEAKSLVAKASKMKGAPASQKMKPAKAGSKNGSSGKALKEEEMPEAGAEDVEAPEMDAAPEGDMGAGGLDVEGLVKELIRVITDKVPGAADVVSVEEEGGEEGEMEGGEEELDEAALENVVAETVKRVKARLMESQKPKTLTKEALAKKVAAKVAERLKKG